MSLVGAPVQQNRFAAWQRMPRVARLVWRYANRAVTASSPLFEIRLDNVSPRKNASNAKISGCKQDTPHTDTLLLEATIISHIKKLGYLCSHYIIIFATFSFLCTDISGVKKRFFSFLFYSILFSSRHKIRLEFFDLDHHGLDTNWLMTLSTRNHWELYQLARYSFQAGWPPLATIVLKNLERAVRSVPYSLWLSSLQTLALVENSLQSMVGGRDETKEVDLYLQQQMYAKIIASLEVRRSFFFFFFLKSSFNRACKTG